MFSVYIRIKFFFGDFFKYCNKGKLNMYCNVLILFVVRFGSIIKSD